MQSGRHAGNHEFDEGKDELMRLLNGGNHSTGPFLENPYRGARFPYVSANVVVEKTGKPILPPSSSSRSMECGLLSSVRC